MRVLPESQSDEAVAEPAEVSSPSRFDADLAKINQALEEQLTSRVPLVEEMAKYSVLGQGKRLRPLLFVLSARICGDVGEDLYRLSALFETVHAASLLHDDVLDNAEVRRKKPSSARVWGNQAAVLGGDFLYSKSFGLAVAFGNPRILEILTDTSIRMAEGQMLELAHTNDWNLSRDTYMEIITAKTAVLTSAACACGAAAAGGWSGRRPARRPHTSSLSECHSAGCPPAEWPTATTRSRSIGAIAPLFCMVARRSAMSDR